MIESKVEMKEEAEKDEYPKLMICKDGNINQGTIVLFDGEASGCILKGEGNHSNCEGEYILGWNMGQFEKFHGTITLSNK